MRLVCISDTHTKHRDLGTLPACDVLIHAGDATWTGEIDKLEDFADWMGEQPARVKLAIAGNHDWNWKNLHGVSEVILHDHGIRYLQDEATVIDGVKFYGSPWQPEFCNWAFNLPRGHELRAKWRAIPSDTEVLITHGPQRLVLDDTIRGERVGCSDLAARMRELGSLRLHVCGHIHHSYGVHSGSRYKSVNASSCDEQYRCVNPPIVVDL